MELTERKRLSEGQGTETGRAERVMSKEEPSVFSVWAYSRRSSLRCVCSLVSGGISSRPEDQEWSTQLFMSHELIF